jgi:lipoprotein-releasing system ATP-binding protein
MMTQAGVETGRPVLSLRGVERRYKSGDRTLHVLRGVDLDLFPGEMAGLIGPSGSGKSTLLHVAGLLEKPDEGTVTFNGQDALKMSDKDRTLVRRLQVGFVYQFHHLLPELNAIDNVASPLMINGVSRSRARKRAQDLLHSMGLKERDHHRPGQLSGGEQQRVAIARAVIARPEMVVADEPTGNVDAEMAARILHLLTALNRLGTTIIVATHDLSLIAATPGAQIIRLDHGAMVDPTGALRHPPPASGFADA